MCVAMAVCIYTSLFVVISTNELFDKTQISGLSNKYVTLLGLTHTIYPTDMIAVSLVGYMPQPATVGGLKRKTMGCLIMRHLTTSHDI
jgi:hypothetical protein